MSRSVLDDVDDDWVAIEPLPTRPKHSANPFDDKAFYACVHKTFSDRLARSQSPVCTAGVDGKALFDCFLENLPAKYRWMFRCDTCRRFVTKYGQLAVIKDDGQLQSLLWNSADRTLHEFFRPAVSAMESQISGVRASKAFVVTKNRDHFGRETSGGFFHFHAQFPSGRVRASSVPAFELVDMLAKVLCKYDIGTVQQTARILNENKLPYSTKHTAAVNWLLDIHENDRIRGDTIVRENLMLRYAMSAFVGCLNQLSNGLLSTLLDNVKANLPWKTIEEQWCKVADPTHYMRPSLAPKAGNIAAAEKLFQELGLTDNDLRRRFLTVDEIPKDVVMWSAIPATEKEPRGGIFANIKPREPSNKPTNNLTTTTPPTPISFTKFATEIMPKARSIEYQLKYNNRLFFLITGLEDTKPLMQWHNDTNRVSWYTYTNPKWVNHYGVKANQWNKVTHILPFPHLWDGTPHTTTFPLESEKSEKFKYYHTNEGFKYLFRLEGGKEEETAKGLNLFPAFMKNTFHGVRSTIEIYSKNGKIESVVDVDAKSGYVVGPYISRDRVGSDRTLLRVRDERGCVGQYEIVLFE